MRGRITIAGLGPAGPDLLTNETVSVIEEATTVRLRTSRHPAADSIDAPSYDHVYENADDFSAVYSTIVEDLVELSAAGDVLYLVPGAPTVAETTAAMLLADDRVECRLLPALSFLDLTWSRLGIDPVDVGVRLVDGHRFVDHAGRGGGPLLVAQCSSRDVLSDIKLAYDDDNEPFEAVLLHHLGLDDEVIQRVPWADIDRTLEADHLTSLFIPASGDASGGAVVRLGELVTLLRTECPWDREQTHGSLRRFLVEETYETIEALDELADGHHDSGYEHLEEELGDLLFQIVFHTTLAAEQGRFTLDDVAGGIHAKLVRRHPHVFEADPASHLPWEELKAAEKAARGVVDDGSAASALDRLPPMPTLPLAVKVASKVARSGFDWGSSEGAWAKVDEEIQELREAVSPEEREHEFGDVVFSLVGLARHLGVEPDTALRSALRRFRERFGAVESAASGDGVLLADLTEDELMVRWSAAKAELARRQSRGSDVDSSS